MELFLLLSIGMSIVAFISVALNQAPSSSPVVEHNLESSFPLESYALSPDNLGMLNADDFAISQGLEPLQSVDSSKLKLASKEKEIQLSVLEAS